MGVVVGCFLSKRSGVSRVAVELLLSGVTAWATRCAIFCAFDTG